MKALLRDGACLLQEQKRHPSFRAAGIGSVRFNTVIKRDNLDQLMPIVELVDQPAAGRSRAEAARLAIGDFDEQIMAERTMALYDRVLGAHR